MASDGQPPSIATIDCMYGGESRASAYLMLEGARAAFVDTNTNHAVPLLLEALDASGVPRAHVDYVIITHVHLDHAGGTAALLEHCPNATVLAHPKAARHLIDPARLVASSKLVYGEEAFGHLYGEILGVPEHRVRAMADDERLAWGERTLRFFYTRGHASHHFCIHDDKTNSVFTGDAFGIGRNTESRPGTPFLICSSTPTDFDAEEARASIERILATGAARAFVGHFGVFDDLELGARQLRHALELHEAILLEALDPAVPDAELQHFCAERVGRAFDEHLRWCGVADFAADRHWLDSDVLINAMGLAFVARRRRARGQAQPTNA